MASVRRYDDETMENGRPVPSDRPEDYRIQNGWTLVWGTATPGPLRIERRGDDTPHEQYRFATDADSSEPWPREVRVSPQTYKHAHGRPSLSGETWKVEYPRGRRPRTRENSLTLEEVPEAVRRVIEEYDGLTLVGSLYDDDDAPEDDDE